MILTDSIFKQLFPLLTKEQRFVYLPYLNLAMARFKINTERRVAMFLAQLTVESTGLTRWVENMNYSAKRLTQVWSRRFPTIAAAAPYANNPKALAIKTYGGRLGNRPNTDDGWRYRGHAPIQATGRDMYVGLNNALGDELGVDFVANPDLLSKPEYGFLASAWIFAVEKKCLPFADSNQIVAASKAINGGTIGLAERKQAYERALRLLPDDFVLDSYATISSEFNKDGTLKTAEKLSDNHKTEGATDYENNYDAPREPEIWKDDQPESDFQGAGAGGSWQDDADTEQKPSGASDDSSKQPENNSGGDVNQKADVIANVGGAESAAEKAKIDAANKLDDTHIEETKKTGFIAKVSAFVTAVLTGQYVIPQFLQSDFSFASLTKLIESFLHGLFILRKYIFAAIIIWFVLRKAESLLIRFKVINVNTDPTKGNVKIISRAPETNGLWTRIKNKIGLSKLLG